ncbi:MAG: T9SS type A sorting domain-containing protein [Saprospiraceae bacterium]|nr:T9SS type A sorting domain-containing protein [Saprospiraceae bacterium]
MKAFFTSLLLLTLTAVWGQRNCGTMDVLTEQLQQNPALQQQMQSIEQHNDHYHNHLHEQVGFRAVVTIPVVFHIIHNGDAVGSNENISDALILAQLQQLNDDFRKLNTDAGLVPALFQGLHADTEIQFCLAQRKPDGTATNGINRVQYSQATWTTSQVNSTVKPATIWNRDQYLNVWSVAFGGSSSGILGYAQFPGGAASTDGVVVAYYSVGSLAMTNPGSSTFGKGRTLTHEVGHWLNLRHIWGDATCGNDLVADTPVHNTSNGGCPTYPHLSTCTGTPVEMTMNYMDYTNDACMYMFTAGQKTRMQAVLATGGARFSLNSSLGCVPPGETNCTAPTLAQLSASNITTSSARINCSVTGVNAYDWRYRVAGTSTWTDLASGTPNFADLSGLAAGTTYEFQAQVQCGSVWSAWSVTQTFTTLSATCAAPTLAQLSVSNITTTSVQLQCSVSGVNAYDWRYRQQGAATWIDLPSTTTGVTTVTGLSASTNYEFQAQVQCGSTWSAWSVSRSFSTTDGSCTTPLASQISISEITGNSARFNVSVTGANSYLWRYRQAGASTWITLPATTVNYTYVFGLSSRTTYEVQVALVCNSITTAWSGTVNFSTSAGGDPVCNAPDVSQLSASNVTTSSAVLNCTAPGATSFTWRYRVAGANTWNNLGTTTQGTFALSGLSPNTTYEFQVMLECSNGVASSWSASQSFTTPGAATCNAPTAAQISATNISTTSAQLNCSIAGQSSYAWRYRLAGAATWTTLPSTSVNSTVVNGLSASSNYEFQVSIQCTNGVWSDWSGAQTFSTAAAACNAPSVAQVSVSNITDASARLNCSVTGVTAYLWRYRQAGASAWIDLGSTSVNFYDLGNLSSSTTYEYAVAVQCGAATSAWSVTQNFTTTVILNCTPPTSRMLFVTGIAPTGATLNCSMSATNYLWRYRPLGTSVWITAGPTTVGSLTVSGLMPQTTYEFQVAVLCGTTQSDWSDSKTFTTSGGTRIEPNHLLRMELWPVPAHEQLFIRYTTPEDATVVITISDMAGRVVLTENKGRQTAGEHLHEMRLEQLPAGTYSIQIQTGKNICREKFIRFAE